MTNPMRYRVLWWREKMYDASTAADCAEMRKHHEMRNFSPLSETGDSPDTLVFYFQHNLSRSQARYPHKKLIYWYGHKS